MIVLALLVALVLAMSGLAAAVDALTIAGLILLALTILALAAERPR